MHEYLHDSILYDVRIVSTARRPSRVGSWRGSHYQKRRAESTHVDKGSQFDVSRRGSTLRSPSYFRFDRPDDSVTALPPTPTQKPSKPSILTRTKRAASHSLSISASSETASIPPPKRSFTLPTTNLKSTFSKFSAKISTSFHGLKKRDHSRGTAASASTLTISAPSDFRHVSTAGPYGIGGPSASTMTLNATPRAPYTMNRPAFSASDLPAMRNEGGGGMPARKPVPARPEKKRRTEG